MHATKQRSKIREGRSVAFSEGFFLMMLWGKAGLYLEVGTAKPYLPYCFCHPCESEQTSCYEKGKRGASWLLLHMKHAGVYYDKEVGAFVWGFECFELQTMPASKENTCQPLQRF